MKNYCNATINSLEKLLKTLGIQANISEKLPSKRATGDSFPGIHYTVHSYSILLYTPHSVLVADLVP